MAKSMMSKMPNFSKKGLIGMGPMFNVIMIAFLFVLAFLIYQLIIGGRGGEGFREGTSAPGTRNAACGVNGLCSAGLTCKNNMCN